MIERAARPPPRARRRRRSCSSGGAASVNGWKAELRRNSAGLAPASRPTAGAIVLIVAKPRAQAARRSPPRRRGSGPVQPSAARRTAAARRRRRRGRGSGRCCRRRRTGRRCRPPSRSAAKGARRCASGRRSSGKVTLSSLEPSCARSIDQTRPPCLTSGRAAALGVSPIGGSAEIAPGKDETMVQALEKAADLQVEEGELVAIVPPSVPQPVDAAPP